MTALQAVAELESEVASTLPATNAGESECTTTMEPPTRATGLPQRLCAVSSSSSSTSSSSAGSSTPSAPLQPPNLGSAVRKPQESTSNALVAVDEKAVSLSSYIKRSLSGLFSDVAMAAQVEEEKKEDMEVAATVHDDPRKYHRQHQEEEEEEDPPSHPTSQYQTEVSVLTRKRSRLDLESAGRDVDEEETPAIATSSSTASSSGHHSGNILYPQEAEDHLSQTLPSSSFNRNAALPRRSLSYLAIDTFFDVDNSEQQQQHRQQNSTLLDTVITRIFDSDNSEQQQHIHQHHSTPLQALQGSDTQRSSTLRTMVEPVGATRTTAVTTATTAVSAEEVYEASNNVSDYFFTDHDDLHHSEFPPPTTTTTTTTTTALERSDSMNSFIGGVFIGEVDFENYGDSIENNNDNNPHSVSPPLDDFIDNSNNNNTTMTTTEVDNDSDDDVAAVTESNHIAFVLSADNIVESAATATVTASGSSEEEKESITAGVGSSEGESERVAPAISASSGGDDDNKLEEYTRAVDTIDSVLGDFFG